LPAYASQIHPIVRRTSAMFLQTPAESEASSRLYKSDLAQQGFVMNLSRLWAWRPEVCEAFSALRGLLTTQSSLSNRELAVIVCATAASLGDSYCALAWGKKLATATDASAAAAVLEGLDSDGLTMRDQALSAWARKVARNPNATTPEDVEQLRAAGFSEREIFEATAFVAFRLAFSTVNDALGVRPDWQLAAAAPLEVNRAVTFGRPTAERIT
jgi:uncharacterized peroxidase-related enzyme